MTRAASAHLLTSDDTSVPIDPQQQWRDLFGSEPPEKLAWVVEQAVAWQGQADAHGDVPPHIQRDLSIIAAQAGASRADARGKAAAARSPQASVATADPRSRKSSTDGAPCASRTSRAPAPLPPASSQLIPGTRLVKSHGGISHVVEVTTDGMLYNGQLFSSLSAVAKHITGTHWNGLLFFGLRKRKTYSKGANG